MARKQEYGLRYPFSCENLDNVYMDTNKTYADSVKSKVVHVIFTPKGQVLRNPDFGTRLIDYVFGPKDSETEAAIKQEITVQVSKYVPEVVFKDFEIYNDEKSDNGIMVVISYTFRIGNKAEDATVAIKL